MKGITWEKLLEVIISMQNNEIERISREKDEELNDAYDMIEGLMKHIDSYNPCQTLEQNYENIINKE